MITRDRSAVSRIEDAPRKRDSGMQPRFVLPLARTAPVLPPQPPEVAAMKEVVELLRSASTPRDVFGRLVEIVGHVIPIDALALVSAPRVDEPLVWTSGAPGLEPLRVAAVADAALGYFQTDAELDDLESVIATPPQPWLSLPITADDGAVLGLLAMAPHDHVDEAALAFVAAVVRHLARLLGRAEQMRVVFAAREHADWLARTADLRFVEERRARLAAERSARSLRTASDATAILLSSFDYRSSLRHVARVLGDELAGGCVFDVTEPFGTERFAQLPAQDSEAVSSALSELVSDVLHYRSAVASAMVSPSIPEGDARSRVVAARARRALEADWIVSVPITTDGSTALGVLTVFGSLPRNAPVAISVVEELARRAALAIENGRAYVAALEASHQREQVLSMVSHDLKNSFGVILMSVARVLEGMPTVERRERGRSQLELIQRSARRMMKLVADLLDVAAIDAGRLSVTPRPCSIQSLLVEVFEELSPQAKTAGVDLVCEIPEGLPLAMADAHRVSQVLTNLIGNAIKFTPEGGNVTASAALVDGNEIAVSIADTGVGIPAAHLAHVFDRFWQGPTGKTGSGLGLAICRGLIERSGGRIWAESTPGVGTTMTFTLPVGSPRSLPSGDTPSVP
jgi:signal transduction histidine kinase